MSRIGLQDHATSILLTPADIGGVRIRNRIVMPPMTTRCADADGYVTEDSLAYYRARARGGVGLITVEMAAPEKVGRHRFHELGIHDDRFLPGLRSLTEVIHAEGAKASIQLGHGGGHTRADICGETPIAPSAIPHPVYETFNETIIPLEMSHARIAQTVAAYASAARRAQQAGFDCVELHGAHGYLISQFLTPFENRRSDAYGGSLENRARFALEVLRAVKAAVGEMPVIFRLSVDDYFPDGMVWDEGRQVAVWVAQAGADALHIAAGHYRSLPSAARQIPPMAEPDATFLRYAAEISRMVAIPVIAVGRLGDPKTAEAAIETGDATFIALGRSLVADPEWVAKLARGEPARRCLACNTCVNEMRGGAKLGCVVNAMVGHERAFETAQAPSGERIAVIGAGPAGLTYASLVAEGNEVTLFERSAGAGGAFNLAGLAPLFQEVEANPASFARAIAQLVAVCEMKGVRFRFNTAITPTDAELAEFDRIVIAIGARYRFGLGLLVAPVLRLGVARWPGIRRLMASPGVRDWFYHRARRAAGPAWQDLAQSNRRVWLIGDARQAGKSKPAIASAFAAALRWRTSFGGDM